LLLAWFPCSTAEESRKQKTQFNAEATKLKREWLVSRTIERP
jgi:hypothetical protein